MSDALNQLIRGPAATFNAGGAVQVNPLAAVMAGNQAAQEEFKTRGLQAQQALGNILQQSTDPNGNVDYQDAQRRAAAAGPVVQMGMQSYLTNNAQLRGAQINQAGALHSLVGNMAASLMNDPSDENLAKIRASAATQLPPSALTEIDRIGALPPEQRGAEAYKHVVANLDTLHQLATTPYGMPESVDTGAGGRVPVQTSPRTPWSSGGASVLSGGVGMGMTQAQLDQPYTYTDENNNVVHTTVGEHLKTMGITPQVGGNQIGGGQPGGAPRTPPPAGTPGSNTPPPPPAGTTARPARPPASTAPATGPQPPQTTPPTTTPPATTTEPTPPPPAGKSIGGPKAGSDVDIAAYKAAQAAMPDQQRSLQAGTAALQAIQLARTGPGTGTSNAMKAFMVAQGIGGADAIDGSTEQYQIARKNLLRFAQSNGGKVGTDLGLSTQLESNPNVDTLLNSVNDHILKQDIGLARQRIAQTMTAPGQGGTGKTEFGQGMGEHVQNFTAKTDPVAFAWDLLTPAERQEHLDQIAKQEGGHAKWERSMKIARDTGAWSRPATPPPAPRAATPPPPNPLTPPSAPY
jgi:hypothetical protein